MGNDMDRIARPRRSGAPYTTTRASGAFELETLEDRRVLAAETDDRFEDNDLPRTVVRAEQGAINSPNLGPVSGTDVIRNLKLLDSADVYRIVLENRGTPADFVRINFNNRSGNLDLQLRAANGTRVLRSSLNNSGPETISLNNLAAGSYFIRVFGKNGATNPNYVLTIKTPEVVANPTEDAYEGNDSREQVDAAPVGAINSPNLGALAGARTLGNLKLNDTYDLFKFSIPSTQGAASMQFVQIASATPLNLVLMNSSGTAVRAADAYFGQRTIDLRWLDGGDYYIQVTHYALATPGSFNYALSFTV